MRLGSLFTRGRFALLPGALAVLVVCSVALARDGDRPRLKDNGRQSSAESRAALVDAPNARMVALVRAPDGKIVMQKGVDSVVRIAKGVYCIRPEAATGIDPLTAVAVVSVEYFYSTINEVQVQWARRQNGCSGDRFAVYTLADENLNAVYNFSNQVGFVIYVP